MIFLIVKILIVLIVLLLLYGYLSNYMLSTERYDISPYKSEEKKEPIRIVMLADLHGTKFGKGNEKLIRKIKEQAPDLVCMAGDMTVKNGKGTEECLALCRELNKICPVYYAPGNHEIRMPEWEQFGELVKESGVNWLDNQQKQVLLRGKVLNVCGLNLPEDGYHKCWIKRDVTAYEMETLLGTPNSDYNILLAHNPEYFETYAKWGADLVCAGHVHGGIARLPILGGVIDPSLRLFPKYDAGRFEIDSSVMILTRGLGTHHIRLRFFNVPEISVIDLHL